MKSSILVCISLCCAIMCSAAFATDIDLPTPQKSGGMPVLNALDNRGSAAGNNFPSGRLNMQDFATILWAATGHNRDGVKWTVPMAMGKAPYIKIYLTIDEGCFLYDWNANMLIQVSETNVKNIIPMQDFAKQAPAAIYFVGNGKELASMPDSPIRAEFAQVLAGAMSQNIYLACEALNIGTRVVYSVDRDAMKTHFKLDENDSPLFAMFLGKK